MYNHTSKFSTQNILRSLSTIYVGVFKIIPFLFCLASSSCDSVVKLNCLLSWHSFMWLWIKQDNCWNYLPWSNCGSELKFFSTFCKTLSPSFKVPTHGDGSSSKMEMPHVEERATCRGQFDHHKEKTCREGRLAWGCRETHTENINEKRSVFCVWRSKCIILSLQKICTFWNTELQKVIFAIPVWGESGVSCVFSVLSLPRIRFSSKTCRSWVSFPCCIEKQQPSSNYIRCRTTSTVEPICKHTDTDASSINLTQTLAHTGKLPEGMREGFLCTSFLLYHGWPFTETTADCLMLPKLRIQLRLLKLLQFVYRLFQGRSSAWHPFQPRSLKCHSTVTDEDQKKARAR